MDVTHDHTVFRYHCSSEASLPALTSHFSIWENRKHVDLTSPSVCLAHANTIIHHHEQLSKEKKAHEPKESWLISDKLTN